MITPLISIIKSFAYLTIIGITLWIINDLWLVLISMLIGILFGSGILKFPARK